MKKKQNKTKQNKTKQKKKKKKKTNPKPKPTNNQKIPYSKFGRKGTVYYLNFSDKDNNFGI